MTLWLSGLVLGLVLGWEAYWWLRMRPFARMVEAKATELEVLMEEYRVAHEAGKGELLTVLDDLGDPLRVKR